MDFDWVKCVSENFIKVASEKTYLISLRKNLYKVSLGKIFANLLKVFSEKNVRISEQKKGDKNEML